MSREKEALYLDVHREAPAGAIHGRSRSARRLFDQASVALTVGRENHRWCTLRRKEVIQPHLPIRLPCYDFVPITKYTFGASLPCGLGQRLRVRSAFVT